MTNDARTLAALAVAGVLLLLLARVEWAQVPPTATGPAGGGIRSEERAGPRAAAPEGGRCPVGEEWHGNVSVSPRIGGGAPR